MFNRDELKGFAACVDDGNGNDTTGSTQVSDARGEGYRDRHDSCDTDLFSRWSEHRIRSDRHRIQREHELIIASEQFYFRRSDERPHVHERPTVSDVISEDGKTSPKRDRRAAHGAARIDRGPAQDSFFHVVELEAGSEHAVDRRFGRVDGRQ